MISKSIRTFVKYALHAIRPSKNGVATWRVLSGPAKGTYLSLDIRLEGAYWIGSYDSWVFSRLKLSELIPEGSVVWDCGAYVGYYAAVFRKCCGDTGAVHVFEASDENYGRLQNLPALNNWSNVYLHHHAIGPEKSMIEFVTSEFGACGPFGFSKEYSVAKDKLVVKQVPCAGVDELVFEMGIAAPSFIKFDLESAEVFALHNGARVFTEIRPTILLEVHGQDAKVATGKFLEDYNYSAVRVEMLPDAQRLLTCESVASLEGDWLMLLCTPEN